MMQQQVRGLMRRAEVRQWLIDERGIDVAEWHIIRADQRGEIPCIALGQRRFYSPEDIDAWLAANRRTPENQADQSVPAQ